MNHRQIIELWPSAKSLAEDLDEKYETVRKWRFRNNIPSDRWISLIEAGKKRRIRVTLESLASQAATSNRGAA